MRRAEPEQASFELNLGTVERPGDSYRIPITVGALTNRIREVLEGGLSEVWVAGEISNLRAPGSGHLYFTLKDEGAVLAAVMFRMEAARTGFALADGMAVIARGTVTVYESRGQYQLQVTEIRARGQGSLQQRFEQLKQRLQSEGLFESARKRSLPVFPQAIGIVTSLQGAVLQDMLRILQRRAPGLRIQVRGVRVQGTGSAPEIAAAIQAFSDAAAVDLVVVARGGGSLEDLWAFNEESVARALAACRLPTISAVGHETDFSIADFVADLRAPTPSAAAELLTRDWADWRAEVAGLRQRLERWIRQALLHHRRHVARLSASHALREPRRVVRQMAQRLDELRGTLRDGTRRALAARKAELHLHQTRLAAHHPARELARRRAHLDHLTARLRALGPQGTLDRGYALVLDAGGAVLTKAAQAQQNQPARVILAKGTLMVQVVETHPAETLADVLLAKPAPSSAPPKAKRRRKPPQV